MILALVQTWAYILIMSSVAIHRHKAEPAIQGGFDVEHSSGLYAGTWASNVDWTTAGDDPYMDKNSIEVDVYAGWAGDLELPFGGIGFDIGVLTVLTTLGTDSSRCCRS